MLLGESAMTNPLLQYPDENAEDGLGQLQRRHASLSEDSITRETYNELVRRTVRNTSDTVPEAARIAGFRGDVAEGTAVGRFIVRTSRVTDKMGLNWTSIVAVSESSLVGEYHSAIAQAIIVGLGLAVATCHMLLIILYEGRKITVKKAKTVAKHQARLRLVAQRNVHRAKAMSNVPLFTNVPPAGIISIVEATQWQTFALGETLCTQGDLATHLFIIASGSCKVSKTIAEKSYEVGALGIFSFFGEGCLVGDGPRIRNATVTATTPTQVLTLSREAVEALVEEGVVDKAILQRLSGEHTRRETLSQNVIGGTIAASATSAAVATAKAAAVAAAAAAEAAAEEAKAAAAAAALAEELEELNPDSQEFFETWARILKPHVLEANRVVRLNSSSTEPPVMEKESVPTVAEKHRALLYIDLVYIQGLSMMYVLSMQKSLNMARLTGYRIFNNSRYQAAYAFFVALFMVQAFIEAPASETQFHRANTITDERQLLAGIEGTCLLVFLLDMVFELWLMGFRAGGDIPWASASILGNTIVPKAISKPASSAPSDDTQGVYRLYVDTSSSEDDDDDDDDEGKRRPAPAQKAEQKETTAVSASKVDIEEARRTERDMFDDAPRDGQWCFDLLDHSAGDIDFCRGLRVILWLVFFVDFVCHLLVPDTAYLTGPGTAVGNDHFDKQALLLPYSAVLRPIWLVTRYKSVRTSLRNFVFTLARAADVFLIFVLLLVIGSIVGVLILSGRMNDTNPTNFNKFDSFLSGLLTLFVYMGSAENYNDLVHVATRCDLDATSNSLAGGLMSYQCPAAFLHLYTIAFQLLGAFLIVSLVIGAFESEFGDMTQEQERDSRKERLLGIVAAFLVLDKDGGMTLGKEELMTFINGTCNTGRSFDMPETLEFSGSMFLEFINEFAHELSAANSTQAAPKQVKVTPYRKCMTHDLQVPPPDAHVNVCGEGQRAVRILVEKEAYWFWVPEDAPPGMTLNACLGWSENKVTPPKTETFATISESGLAHWICYHQRLQDLPFKMSSTGSAGSDDLQAKTVRYHRYLAADLAATASVMAQIHEDNDNDDDGDDDDNTAASDPREICILRSTPASGGGAIAGKEATTIMAPAVLNPAARRTCGDKQRACGRVLEKYFYSTTHRHIVLMCLVIHTIALMLYGQGRDITGADAYLMTEDELDFLCAGFVVLWIIEIAARIFCVGPRAFWSLNGDFFRQQANRFDFGVMSITLGIVVASIVCKLSGLSEGNTHGGPMVWFVKWGSIGGYNDWSRLALAIPLLRVFSTIRRIRDTTMGLLTVLPSYGHVLTLLLCVVYFYAVVGCFLFASEMKYNANYNIPMSNFNSMLDSILTLFQLFVGAGFNSVMYAAMQTGKEFEALVFFISYVLLITLLFTNLIIGVICSGFEAVNDARKQNLARAARIRVMNAELRSGTNTNDTLVEDFGGDEGGDGDGENITDDEDDEDDEDLDKVSVAAITAALKEGEAPDRQLKLSYTGFACQIDYRDEDRI